MNPLIVALDYSDYDQAKQMSVQLCNKVGGIKLGLEYITAGGRLTRNVVLNHNLFIDLKLHDIPNTVGRSVRNLVKFNPKFITVHAAGGIEMMRAAKNAAYKQSLATRRNIPQIIGVTTLTSREIDIGETLLLVHDCLEAGIDGIVCSGTDAKEIRKNFQEELTIISPGIRLNKDSNDHKKIVTPKEALDNGADWLVVGRPITEAKYPIKVVDEILGNISDIL